MLYSFRYDLLFPQQIVVEFGLSEWVRWVRSKFRSAFSLWSVDSTPTNAHAQTLLAGLFQDRAAKNADVN